MTKELGQGARLTACEGSRGPTLAEQIAALKVEPMTDEELAKFLGLTPAQAPLHLPKVTPEDRAVYEQMRAVELLCPLWQSGVEPYPSDVSVNRGRERRPKGRKPREAQPPQETR